MTSTEVTKPIVPVVPIAPTIPTGPVISTYPITPKLPVISTAEVKKPIVLTSWSPIATWRFKTTYVDCPICKSKLEQTCADCEANHSKGDLLCDVSKGNCGHCFHKHCIDKWIKTSSICPICSTPYNISVKNMNNTEDWKGLARSKK